MEEGLAWVLPGWNPRGGSPRKAEEPEEGGDQGRG